MVSNQIFTPVHQEVRTTFLLREETLVYCEQDRQVVRSAEHPLANKKKRKQTKKTRQNSKKKKKKRLSITVRLMDVRINALFLNHCLFTIYSNIQPLPKPQYLYILHRNTIKRLVISF